MIRPVTVNVCQRLLVPVACLLMAACATRPGLDTPDAAQPEGSQRSPTAEAAAINREKAIVSYRDYLARYPDGSEHDEIIRRLADLLVEQAADLQVAAATAQGNAAQQQAAAMQAYADAIRHYEYLLDKYPHGPDTTDILYQLSRACEESGESQRALTAIDRLLQQAPHTNMRLYADTRFRRGELKFSEGAFVEAAQSYRAVVDLGPSMPAYEQALYKLGWSLYKQEQYPDALTELFRFLDRKIPPGASLDVRLSQLSSADQEQVADVFRVTSMTFAALGGVLQVAVFFNRHGHRSYEQRIYLDLADFYVEQDQVNEAARTWMALAQRDPRAALAPRLLVQAIELYRQAGFQQRVIETETVFVRDYGLDSGYWTQHSVEDFPDVLLALQTSLQELAHVAHAQARETDSDPDYRSAERWYRTWLAGFGDTPAAAEINYQLAELLYESGRYQAAIEEYERTAWSRGEHQHAPAAALGALHASDKLLQQETLADRQAVSERATAATVRFVLRYPNHPAAAGLLGTTGTVLLQQQRYDTALRISERVLTETAAAPAELEQTAWSIQAQAQFGLENYAAAAAAYGEALQLTDKADPRRAALQQGLATATYQQAQQTQQQGDNQAAVNLYQQAAQLAPQGKLRASAQYDAATALLAQQSWQQAIVLLQRYRVDYPDDPLQTEVTRKLAYAHEQVGHDQQAAAEYWQLGQDRKQNTDMQREALLRAGDLYLQAGKINDAVNVRKLYLERFPEPATVAVGVMQQLADLETADSGKRQHWLEAIIVADRAGGTEETRVIAAAAALELANRQLADFRRIQLVNPVKKSLSRKLQAMKQALQAFESAIDYGVSPVITAATYQIATMYDELGDALLASERPGSLTDEELAEYDVLLAEQAAPFEQQAIDVYTTNAQRSSSEPGDPWIEKSVQRLAELQGGQ
jgi:tetratricopeptide (TPR) repeat protein